MHYRFARFVVIALLLLLCGGAPPLSARAQTANIRIESTDAKLEFPERITFRAKISGEQQITRVVLEYGVAGLSCAEVVAKAFPSFTPANTVEVSWTWEMLQSGSEPPGSSLWYRWRVTDATGSEFLSPEQTLTWLDDQHNWQSVTEGMVTLHWYQGSRAYANDLLQAASDGLALLERDMGMTLDTPTNMYIYANTKDMRDAVLYEPGWTGGLAYPTQNIVIIGISPDQIEWGRRTVAHELTHVLIGHLTFSCMGSVPTWLNEGIAMYAEGSLDASNQQRLDTAIREDTLISVRSLSGGFSEQPDLANLSYAQSYSLVDFLVNTYGSEKLLELFGALRDGSTPERALQEVYGFDLDGFEQAWRTAIGAQPLRTHEATPTPTVEPSPVPTYPPVSNEPMAIVIPPTRTDAHIVPTRAAPQPTSVPAEAAPASESSDLFGVNVSQVMIGILLCGVVIVLGVVIVMVLVLRRTRRGTE